MKASNVAKMFLGSLATYVTIVACGSGSPYEATTESDAGHDSWRGQMTADGSDELEDASEAGSDDAPLVESGPKESGIIDALLDPVSDAKADVNQSGTRLKAKYYLGADGSKRFIGLWDSLLNTDCAYGTSSDNQTRCMPAVDVAHTSSLIGQQQFTDAICTKPIFNYAGACPPKGYYQSTEFISSQNCGQSSALAHIYTFGNAVTDGMSLYERKQNNTCVQLQGVSTSSAYDLLEVTPDNFVQATVEHD